MRDRLCCGARRKQRISPSVSAPLHLILQAPTPASHEWRKVGGTSHLCQICHLTLDKEGLRCKDCGLSAHSQCGSLYPSALKSSSPGNQISPQNLGTTGTSGTRFEPRIKKLIHVSIPVPPMTSVGGGSDQSTHLSSSSTPLLLGGGTEETLPRSESKTPETTGATPGTNASSPEDLQSDRLYQRIQVSPEPLGELSSSEVVDQAGGHTPSLPGGRALRYVDGPIDGALYALVKPKGPSSADSGISVTVDQMKDLDRLLAALVEDAESIPDIPYHARQDSLPFSYGVDQNALRQHPRQHQQQSYQPQQTWMTSPKQEHTVQSKQAQAITPTTLNLHSTTSPLEKWNRSQAPSENWTPAQKIQVDVVDSSRNPNSYLGYPSSSYRSQPITITPSKSYGQNRESLRRDIYASPTSTSHSFNDFGRGIGVEQRVRSSSVDGRKTEDADAWLARQLERLQQKKNMKHPAQNDFLAELKRSLPRDRSLERGNSELFRPSSVTRVHSRSTASTPAFYSSDDDDFDTEVEALETAYESPYGHGPRSLLMGRRVERVQSDTLFDRMQRAASSQNYARIGSGSESQRATPGFPTCPPTPYLNRPHSPAKPPRSPKSTTRSTHSTPTTPTTSVNDWVTSAEATPRSQTPLNLNPRPVFLVESEVKFARDLSSFWYKPNASREETISALRYQRPGAFLIRNSNSFPGAYGLALKVDERRSTEDSVRHFLIEPTKYGVRLRGSAVEPVFSSLSALVYAHSIETLALPTTLVLPTSDSILPEAQSESTTAHLLAQGAACQLLFLGLSGVECVSGEDAIARGIRGVLGLQSPTVVSLRLSKQGLTLTDVFRQRFFRLHFPLPGISYAALDPERRTVTYKNAARRIFGVVARSPSAGENSCIVLAELEDGQPAQAIVAFCQRTIAWNQN